MHNHNRFAHWLRRTTLVGVATALAFAGVVALSTPAFAHTNLISGVATCASPLGTGYQVQWTVANNWNLSERAHVTGITGGIATINPSVFDIQASGDGSGGAGTTPYASATLTQVLPSTISGTTALTVTATYADAFQTTNSGSVVLPLNCLSTKNFATPPTAVTTLPPAPVVTLPPAPVVTLPPTPVVTLPVVAPVTPTPSPLVSSSSAVSSPSLSIVKTERVGSQEPFVRGPLLAAIGERIDYRIVVTNTGDTSLSILMTDPRCDANTLSPAGQTQALATGSSLVYTCSHLLPLQPSGSVFRNVATVVGTSPEGISVGPLQSAVTARVFAPVLKVRTLVVAKPAKPILKQATFTG